MTKIAIYGDSFASTLEGWPNYLKSLYKNSRVDVFALAGSSANFSYMRFLETHEKYDLIIFLWTHHDRNCLISRNYKKRRYEIHGFVHGFYIPTSDDKIDNEEFKNHLKDNIKRNLDFNKNVKDNIKEYNKKEDNWIVNETFYAIKYESKNFLENIAMRDSVKLKRPDSINIECFDNPDYPNLKFFKHEYGIGNIAITDRSQYDHELGGLDLVEYKEVIGMRFNHMTMQQNKEFAEYLYRHINGELDVHNTFVKPKKYYTMSKTLEESGFLV